MSNLDHSTHPLNNANVFASAGSGKTWLLIARICRLLLAGADPQHILAITFTRKSAAEMRARLFDTLESWAVADDRQLSVYLTDIGESDDTRNIKIARCLYEKCLFSEQRIRISTFHAFCEEVIRAFPLESELPTSFEVSEHFQLYATQAWQQLLQQSERDQKLHEALDELYKFCYGYQGARKALMTFLAARSEWLTYILNREDPVNFAYQNLLRDLGNEKAEEDTFLTSDQCIADLQNYRRILLTSSTQTHRQWASKLELLFETEYSDKPLFIERLKAVFLTGKNEIRKLTISKKWQTSLSADDYQHLTDTHGQVGALLLNLINAKKHNRLLRANRAWYFAGHQFLRHFQTAKFSQGIIDFNDLEWETFRLLQHEHNVQWVQYKLGQRIRHFLVDEFQDTNPTQWHLLKPLVEASHEQHENNSASLFLVGDVKQSIYRFRGANPQIQAIASTWSQEFLNSNEICNDHSWRSSPAIINLVNKVFTHPSMQDAFGSFLLHSCQHEKRWGKVKILPLTPIEEKQELQDFRDPLSSPFFDSEESAHFHEGCQIADEIRALIDDETPVYEGDTVRPANYGDIIILTRNRSHLKDIKAGLLQAGIPFNANDPSRLLEYLEIKDMMALLKVLVDPYDDLNLVHVLRSPIFHASDQDLIELRKADASGWWKKLELVASTKPPLHPLLIAFNKLTDWQNLTDHIPVHDLMSHIYNSANILANYQSSVAEFEAAHVGNRLNQFLHQCLELDSGRYSGISRFLRKLKLLNPEVSDSSDNHGHNAVEIITVHSAKGLEAPIVFIADSGPNHEPPEQFRTLTHWPAEVGSPTSFLLGCSKDKMSESATLFSESIKTRDEELNLLYVALTRAKQILLVTGSQSRRNGISWHQILCNILEIEAGEIYEKEFSARPVPSQIHTPAENIQSTEIPEALFRPLSITKHEATYPEAVKSVTREGIIIHKLLEILSESSMPADQQLVNRISLETRYEVTPDELQQFKQEAMNCLQNENVKAMFKLSDNQQAFNEFAIATTGNQQKVNIIDRLIISEELAWIIDFKTQGNVSKDNARQLAQTHIPQLSRYKQAVALLYPGLPIRCSIVFTKLPTLVDLEI